MWWWCALLISHDHTRLPTPPFSLQKHSSLSYARRAGTLQPVQCNGGTASSSLAGESVPSPFPRCCLRWPHVPQCCGLGMRPWPLSRCFGATPLHPRHPIISLSLFALRSSALLYVVRHKRYLLDQHDSTRLRGKPLRAILPKSMSPSGSCTALRTSKLLGK